MLGWEIFIQRVSPHGKSTTLIAWSSSIGGLDWLDTLEKQDKARKLTGNGYPTSYQCVASDLLPIIRGGLPEHDGTLVIGDDYFAPPGCKRLLKINQDEITECPPDAELIVEAWDQS